MGFPTSDTFSTLTDEVLLALSGFGMNEDQDTYLLNDIAPSDLSFTVADIQVVSKGTCEVGDEIVKVSSINGASVTVAPQGRGWRGTTATAHTAGTVVNYKPTWARAIVARAINDAILGVYPMLFGVDVVEVTPDTLTTQYAVPSNTERVLRVEQRLIGFKEWLPVSEWALTFQADTADFSTGVYVNLPCIATLGVVRIWRAFRPVALSSPSDLFTTTGLSASAKEVIVLGACARLIGWLDVGRLPVATVEGDALTQNRPLGSAIQAASNINQKYQARLMDEQRVLEQRFPPRIHGLR